MIIRTHNNNNENNNNNNIIIIIIIILYPRYLFPREVLQEAQLMLTTGSTRLAVSRGQQTWYHFRSIATFR